MHVRPLSLNVVKVGLLIATQGMMPLWGCGVCKELLGLMRVIDGAHNLLLWMVSVGAGFLNS